MEYGKIDVSEGINTNKLPTRVGVLFVITCTFSG